MSRRPAGSIAKPERHGHRWRVEVRDPTGTRTRESFSSEDAAWAYYRTLRIEIDGRGSTTIGDALAKWREHLTTCGLRPQSISRAILHVRQLVSGAELDAADEELVASLLPNRVAVAYEEATRRLAVDTHRTALQVLRRWCRWCIGRGWLARDPTAGVQPIGLRRRGREQLRGAESVRYAMAAVALAREGRAGAVAALLPLILGLRSGEVRNLLVRDVDVIGRQTVIWITRGKTRRARRAIEVPDTRRVPLARLLRGLCAGRAGEDLVWPGQGQRANRGRAVPHCDHWMIDEVDAVLARADISRGEGEQAIRPHGVRGSAASLAEQASMVPHAIAAWLGHADAGVTRAHYSEPAAVAAGEGRARLRVLEGGADGRGRKAKRPHSAPTGRRAARK